MQRLVGGALIVGICLLGTLSQAKENTVIRLLAENPIGSNWSPPKWTNEELKQASIEAVAIVYYFDKQYAEMLKSGDSHIIRNDKALEGVARASFIYSIRGTMEGPFRPCHLALEHFTEGYMSVFDENGARYPQWREWMRENVRRCEDCLRH